MLPYLNQSLTFCLGPLSSFLRLMPTTLETPSKVAAILFKAATHTVGSKNWSPKKPLPSLLAQHHPGLVRWLSNITITSLFPNVVTTICRKKEKKTISSFTFHFHFFYYKIAVSLNIADFRFITWIFNIFMACDNVIYISLMFI